MKSSSFTWLFKEFEELILVISRYVDYLQKQQKITATNHGSEVFVRDVEQATSIKVHQSNIWIKPQNEKKYYELKNVLQELPFWKPFNIEEYLPLEPMCVI